MLREIRITPSILNADLSHLDQEIALIAAASDFLHLDVMDNIFVPNFTFDFERASQIIKNSPIGVDAHLMVADVDNIAPAYAQAGAMSVTIHVEATRDIVSTLKAIHAEGARTGIAFKPATQVSSYAKFLDDVDMFLIMSVEPGFGGQKFMHEMLDKIRQTRLIIGDRPIWLQVDGGISLDTIAQAAEAGADTFVAGSAVFSSADPVEMIRSLRDCALSVTQ